MIAIEVSVQDLYWSNSDPSKISPITWETWVTDWINTLMADLPITTKGYELSLVFVTDEKIQTLNRDFRMIDQPTDVLSFAMLELDLPQPGFNLEPIYLGDIIISVDTAKKQAEEAKHTLIVELANLASHGLLHLIGWDHPDDPSLARMLKQQTALLAKVGLID